MPQYRVPDSVADRMAELIFEDFTVTSRDHILYPGCGDGELIAAVDRYYNDKVSNPPTGVAIDKDPKSVEKVREKYGEHVEVHQKDFLSADIELDTFEFILGYPPNVEWTALSDEKQQEYATSFAQISPSTNQIHTGLLFLERSLHVLTTDGIGVFLTTTGFKTQEKGPFRSYLAPKVADIEAVDNAHFDSDIPHMVLKITSPESKAFAEATSAVRPDPSEVESQLMASAGPEVSPTAVQIATCFPDLEVYASDDDAAFVYLDLYYEDYDAALVYDDPDRQAGLQGYVSRAELEIKDEETVLEHVSPLMDTDCLSPSADMGTVIDRLGRDGERFCFVGTVDQPEGIVTRFDLNSLSVYQYLNTLLARFEIQLRDIIRNYVPDWETETEIYISTAHVGELAPDKLAGATLGDLLEILEEADETHRIPVNLDMFNVTVWDLKQLRDTIAHYKPLIHSMSNDTDSSWTAGDLRDRYHLLRGILVM